MDTSEPRTRSSSSSSYQQEIEDNSSEDSMNPVFKFLNPCRNSFSQISQHMEPLADDGLIKKTIITEGRGITLTNDHEIFLHYAGYLENHSDHFDASATRSMIPRRYLVNDKALLPGFRICLRSMKEFEVAQFYINHTLAFGELGCPPVIPPCADIMLVISTFEALECGHLVNVASIEDNTSLAELLEALNSYIHLGLHNYRHKKYRQAYNNFYDAALVLKKASYDSYEDHRKYMIYLKNLYISRVACLCQNTLFKPKKLLKLAREAEFFTINGVQDNMTYNLCIGVAHLHLNNHDSAREYVKRAQSLEPKNTEITKLIIELNKRTEKCEKCEKQIWRRAFSAMGITSKPSNVPSQKPNSDLLPIRKVMEELLTSFMNNENDMQINLGCGYTQVERLIIKEVAENIGIQYEEALDGGF